MFVVVVIAGSYTICLLGRWLCFHLKNLYSCATAELQKCFKRASWGKKEITFILHNLSYS